MMTNLITVIILLVAIFVIFLALIYDDLINKWVLSSSYLLLGFIIVVQRFNRPKKNN